MLLVAAVTVVILLYCLILHYKKHFRFQLYKPRTSSSRRLTVEAGSTDFNINNHDRGRALSSLADEAYEHQATYRCMFTSADSEDFDFFPVAFFFYLTFLILICGILIAKCFIFDLYYDDDIGEYFIKSYNEHFNSLKSHDQESLFNDHGIGIIKILDWILVYSIMILSIWESLFLFYRYYTTLVSTTKYYHPSSFSVFKRFSFYMIIFIFSFISYIHVTYYMFPVVVTLYLIFNVYCTMKFASLLIQKYRLFITMGQSQQNKDSDKDILRSVYFMRKTSLFCTMVQSLSLTLFVISYNVDIMYYIPILWGISCFMFTLNFVRNRQSINAFAFNVFWCCRYSKCCTYFEENCILKIKRSRRNRKITDLREILTVQHSNKQNIDDMNESNMELAPNNHEIDGYIQYNTANRSQPATKSSLKKLRVDIKSHDHILAASDSMPNTPNSPQSPDFMHTSNGLTSPSVPVELARASIIHLPPKNPTVRTTQSAYQQKNTRFNQNNNRIKERAKNKAFAILGLVQQSDASSSISPDPSPIVVQHKRAITHNVSARDRKVKFLDEKQSKKKADNLHLSLNSSSVPNMNPTTNSRSKQKQLQQPTVSTIKEEIEKKEKSMDIINDEEDREQTVVITLGHIINKVSTPATPLIIDHTAYSMPTPLNNDKTDPKTPKTPIIMNELNELNELNEQDLNDCDDFIYLDDDDLNEKEIENEENDINIIYNNDDIKEKEKDKEKEKKKNNDQYRVNVEKITVTQHTKLNDINLQNHYHSKSRGRKTPKTPAIDETSIDLEKVVKSLQILVDYGFCSRLSVNNIKQIKSYRDAQIERFEDIEEEQDEEDECENNDDNNNNNNNNINKKPSPHHYRT